MTAGAHPRRRFLAAGSRAAAGVAWLGVLPSLRAHADAGQHGLQDQAVVSLAFDPADRTLFKATANAVHRSADLGRHWSPVGLPMSSTTTGLKSINVAAGAPGALYVAGHGIGVQRSDDGGRTWSARNEGLPSIDVQAFATHADRPETVYAYLKAHGIYRSEDGGRHWRLMDAGPRGGITGLVHSNMPGSMQSGWFFAAGPQGVRRAMDCFCSWRDAGELGRAVRAIAYDPKRPSEVYAAAGSDLFVSRDGGEAWSKFDAPPSEITALAVTPTRAIYAAGADGQLFVAAGAAGSWERIDA